MSECSCRRALSEGDPKERAANVHAAANTICGCEQFAFSAASPGIVLDSEVLHYVVSDPRSLLPSGHLNPAFLMQIDRGGLSVLRDRSDSLEFELTFSQLQKTAESANSEWYFYGVCSFTAERVRYRGSDRFLCVYDTPLEQKPNHADLMAPLIDADSKTARIKAERIRQKELVQLIGSTIISARDFRGGEFSHRTRKDNNSN